MTWTIVTGTKEGLINVLKNLTTKEAEEVLNQLDYWEGPKSPWPYIAEIEAKKICKPYLTSKAFIDKYLKYYYTERYGTVSLGSYPISWGNKIPIKTLKIWSDSDEKLFTGAPENLSDMIASTAIRMLKIELDTWKQIIFWAQGNSYKPWKKYSKLDIDGVYYEVK